MTLRQQTLGRYVVPALVAGTLAGCTSGNSAIEPPFQSVNISTIGKLQFAIGTANIAYPVGTQFVGLNTVVTFRQASGATATAVNSPQIIGPRGFVVPADPNGESGNDAGKNVINNTVQGGSLSTTFGTSGQATLYGFGPNNYDTSGTANFGNYALPLYEDTLGDGKYAAQTFFGLPPAFPAAPGGTGFPGYNPGFVDFAAAAVSGTYKLNVTVPTSPGSSQNSFTYTASAALNAAKVLPPFAQPAVALDAAGGGTIAVTLPAGVTQALVEFTDSTSGAANTFLFNASGAQTIPDGSITAGDSYTITAVGFDYNAFAPAAPANTSQTPVILGGAGQDDITVSAPLIVGTAVLGGAHRRPQTIRRMR